MKQPERKQRMPRFFTSLFVRQTASKPLKPHMYHNGVQQIILSILIGFVCLFVFSLPTYALPDDKKSPIELSADSADLDQSKHRGEYTGRVDFRQGTSHITANRAITNVNKANKLILAIAYGTTKEPARFSTKTDLKKPTLFAQAHIIRYYPQKHLVELEGHAKVTQGQDQFEADIIRYNTLEQHVISASKGKNRTVITINSSQMK